MLKNCPFLLPEINCKILMFKKIPYRERYKVQNNIYMQYHIAILELKFLLFSLVTCHPRKLNPQTILNNHNAYGALGLITI